jgi:Domain of unknown function (DUF1918)
MLSEQQVQYGDARPGDWIEADSPGATASRRGQILEVLGSGAHEHYRVRWDEAQESLFYPADHARIYRTAATEWRRPPVTHAQRGEAC